jgi:phosphotransferase system HPr-like phosphotransfer protein
MTCTISSFEKAKEFVITANQCEYDVNVSQGRYIVDGKSIVGVLSLNLLNPVQVQCVNRTEEALFEKYAS